MMKSYYDYMHEITADELYKGLLGYGLFADKLPNVFTSEVFYEYCIKMNSSFVKQGNDYIRYDTIRNTNALRNLAIPTPFAYANLCGFLRDNWDNLLQHFQDNTHEQKFKCSQIHIQRIKDAQHLFEMSLSYEHKDLELETYMQKMMVKCNFKATADISNCFPSIYSHSLSWALVGKNKAKTDKNNDKVWYNKLDKLSRYTKNNETNGLLIGPHASNLLSEIILTCVDHALSPKYTYYRNIDDFTCYVSTETDAQHFLMDLTQALKKFELTLNAKKTQIIRLPVPTDEDWISALQAFYIGNKKTEDNKVIFEYKRLRSFLDLTIRLANQTQNLAVYTYAIKMIADKYLGKKALQYYLNTLHHLLLQYPYLVHVIDEKIFIPFDVSTIEIQEIANNLYKVGIHRRIYEPCAFALYWAMKYDFRIDVTYTYISDSIKSNDCVFLLMSYLYAKKIKDDYSLLFNEAQKLMAEIDRYWLFCYEVLPGKELPNEYKQLKKQNVTFIRKDFL